jgi:O-antigen/teichoic acid export membrane protein
VVQVSNILVLMTGRLDLLLVYHLASPATAGTYSIALTIGALVASVPLALAYAAFPRLARLDEEESRALVSQLTRIGLAAALLTGAVLAIASPIAIPLVFGSAYRSALTPTLLLIPGGVLGAGQWLLTRSATARGVPRVVVLSYAVSLLVMLALDLALIPGSGAEGAAIAATVSQLAGMLVPLPYYVRRQWRISEFIPRPRDVVYLGASLRQMLVRSR